MDPLGIDDMPNPANEHDPKDFLLYLWCLVVRVWALWL